MTEERPTWFPNEGDAQYWDEQHAIKNTDREIWREHPDDYYSDSIHVTEGGSIGIDCGGFVIVKPVREWHKLARDAMGCVCGTGSGRCSVHPPQEPRQPKGGKRT